jgi:hypothetical protein
LSTKLSYDTLSDKSRKILTNANQEKPRPAGLLSRSLRDDLAGRPHTRTADRLHGKRAHHSNGAGTLARFRLSGLRGRRQKPPAPRRSHQRGSHVHYRRSVFGIASHFDSARAARGRPGGRAPEPRHDGGRRRRRGRSLCGGARRALRGARALWPGTLSPLPRARRIRGRGTRGGPGRGIALVVASRSRKPRRHRRRRGDCGRTGRRPGASRSSPPGAEARHGRGSGPARGAEPGRGPVGRAGPRAEESTVAPIRGGGKRGQQVRQCGDNQPGRPARFLRERRPGLHHSGPHVRRGDRAHTAPLSRLPPAASSHSRWTPRAPTWAPN